MTKDTDQKTGQVKTCTKCGETKTLDQFHNNKNTKSGKAQHCKLCCKISKQSYLERTRKPRKPQFRIWTHDKIMAVAMEYSTRIDFAKGNRGAHAAAIRSPEGLDHFCAHMPPARKPWTFKELLEVARKYSTIGEFRRAENGAYNAGLRSGRKEELYAHMVQAHVETPRFIYVIQSQDGKTAYVGLSQKPRRRYGEHRRHGKESVRRLIAGPHTFSVVSESLGERAARALESETVDRLKNDGVDVLNSVIAGNLGALGTFRWTEEAIAAEALKYKTPSEFRNGSPGAYAASRRTGDARKFCGHMKFLNTWDEASIAEEAKKHSTRTEFEKACGSAVSAARRLGIMDKVCTHMEWRARWPNPANDNELQDDLFTTTTTSEAA